MLRQRLPLVLSVTALVVAVLGATPAVEAAQQLVVPKLSVGTAQLKKDAVTSAKVKNRSLLAVDFKLGQLPRGAAGPPGPAGEKGDKGDKGDKGEPGAATLANLQYVTATTASNANATKAAQATCPPGKKAVGGGAFTTGSTGGTAIRNSSPVGNGAGWIGVAAAITAQPNGWALNVVAVCATAS